MSASALNTSRAGVVGAVWSRKMPLASTLVVLNLADGPAGVDPAFHIVWSRFRLMCRYLAHRPDEIPVIFRMMEHGAPGHGLVHLLMVSAAETGFVWDGDGFVRSYLLSA